MTINEAIDKLRPEFERYSMETHSTYKKPHVYLSISVCVSDHSSSTRKAECKVYASWTDVSANNMGTKSWEASTLEEAVGRAVAFSKNENDDPWQEDIDDSVVDKNKYNSVGLLRGLLSKKT